MRKLRVLLLCALFVLSAQPSWAGIYLSISDTGTFTLSNRPTDEAFNLITGTKSREDLNRTDRAVEIAAGKYGLPKSLIYSVMRNVGRNQGGVMGLPEDLRSTMPDTAVRNIQKNILAGSKHLSELLVEFDGNLMLTLGAYRTSVEAVKKNDGLPAEQTRAWVQEVQKSFKNFETQEEIIYTYKDDEGVVHAVNIQP